MTRYFGFAGDSPAYCKGQRSNLAEMRSMPLMRIPRAIRFFLMALVLLAPVCRRSSAQAALLMEAPPPMKKTPSGQSVEDSSVSLAARAVSLTGTRYSGSGLKAQASVRLPRRLA